MTLFSSTVLALTQLSSDTFLLTLSSTESFARHFIPGQFVMVGIPESTRYDPLLKRPFSVCRVSPEQMELAIKVVGRGTAILSNLSVGSRVSMHGPLGNGYPLDTIRTTEKLLLAAGGIGIASLMSLVEFCRSHDGSLANVEIIVGAQTASQLTFVDRLVNLAEQGLQISLVTDDGSKGEKGLVTDAIARQLNKNSKRPTIVSCGPLPMLKAVGALAKKFSCPCYLSLESRMACGFGVCLGCVTRRKPPVKGSPWLKVCSNGPVFSADMLDL
ncbi:MAG: dihydroorotate dehydrogenase electron transfer subunit [Deltaproteobacteria bacterium]|nr:dihydroorotate dehydrogenase electron transfer subunit [Candidatus Anaeroferrophillus wilburensis]MBN2888284.1 dihydroorotate dehydrogenase electron transfer subunit [Deltaproteobacteria bacterium]